MHPGPVLIGRVLLIIKRQMKSSINQTPTTAGDGQVDQEGRGMRFQVSFVVVWQPTKHFLYHFQFPIYDESVLTPAARAKYT